MEVDLLAGEYGGTGGGHRTQPVQDARARKARGADLVFDAPVPVEVEGELPGGGRDRVTVRVAGVVPWLVMKGMALAPRLVADFEAVTDPEARDLIRRAAYEEVRQWLDALDVPPWVEP